MVGQVGKVIGFGGLVALAMGVFAGAARADSGWTPYFSEEQPSGQFCPGGERVEATSCTGSYCDNIALYCGTLPTGVSITQYAFMSSYFSDETGARECLFSGAWGAITGMKCTNSYCDNMYIECGRTTGTLSGCAWTGWVSEEAGTNAFVDKTARAAQCSGDYCDSMRYLVCNHS